MKSQTTRSIGMPSSSARTFSLCVGRSAVRALYGELVTYPKPGLVSRVDSGSHRDMDATTFMRSLFALRQYFSAIALAGAQQRSFEALQELGVEAERRMLKATQGVNTHRGAVFSLGLMAAAAGALYAEGRGADAIAVCRTVGKYWGEDIRAAAAHATTSHGARAAQRYGVGGARMEAALGFPHVLWVGLPALRAALADGHDRQAAAVQCFFALLARVEDTNLLHRRGRVGLDLAQSAARDFLASGGVDAKHWRARALSIHRDFVARELSAGGCADMLAATLFLHQLEQ